MFSSTRRSTSSGVSNNRPDPWHLAQLDVEVAGELVPADLHRPSDQVGPLGRLSGRSRALAPLPFQGQPGQHRRLARAGRRTADRYWPLAANSTNPPACARSAFRFPPSAGYSSLSTMFLSRHSSISRCDLRLDPSLAKRRQVHAALPSSISSSRSAGKRQPPALPSSGSGPWAREHPAREP